MSNQFTSKTQLVAKCLQVQPLPAHLYVSRQAVDTMTTRSLNSHNIRLLHGSNLFSILIINL